MHRHTSQQRCARSQASPHCQSRTKHVHGMCRVLHREVNHSCASTYVAAVLWVHAIGAGHRMNDRPQSATCAQEAEGLGEGQEPGVSHRHDQSARRTAGRQGWHQLAGHEHSHHDAQQWEALRWSRCLGRTRCRQLELRPAWRERGGGGNPGSPFNHMSTPK